MNIAIIGCGYVGLVSGGCFASAGWTVTCVDNEPAKIGSLRQGRIPIYEPRLEEMLRENMRLERLSFTTEIDAAVSSADVVFIAVGTPALPAGGQADLSHVFQVVGQMAGHLCEGAVIVVKSTVPVGTGDEIERQLRRLRPDARFAVVSNPEFLREGAAVEDFMRPDRIVIGAEDNASKRLMLRLYHPITLDRVPVVVTRRRTSELIKYAANAFLVSKITFINEMADLCENIGADIGDVALGIGLDHRIGCAFLQAGPGYGGSCFPKDTMALLETARSFGTHLRVVEAAVAGNEARKRGMALKVAEACGGSVRGRRIAVLGLAFKPGTDDIRESPAITIIRLLQGDGAEIVAYDPEGMTRIRERAGHVLLANDAYACMQGADALVILTDWPEFSELDLNRVKALLREPVVVDLRNILSPEKASAAGLAYVGVGRPVSDGDNHIWSLAAE